MKPDEKDSEDFNIERILIDVNIEYTIDFLNSISKPDEVLFISGGRALLQVMKELVTQCLLMKV